ncbi:ABC transporter ATP-binding protein [Luteimicrobium sp. DT211]|uniref:ABC transporter ATP-binding protein n=1 Tax=Luteimicrobium sp. DT211 TaxID=3393412 RepID=UPI003CE99F28
MAPRPTPRPADDDPTPRSTAVLRCERLTIGYADIPVAAPVDVELAAGDLVAVIGANGTGKSTLLRTVLGLQLPVTGAVTAFGRAVDERSRDLRARVVSVLDDDASFPGLTVREHLTLVARAHRVSDTDAVVDAAVDALGLGAFEETFPHALSSGQRRRFLLASAFVRPRELLVLDEPEQRLDLHLRDRLAELLREEADAGVAVLFATHDERLLTATGAHVLALGEGRSVLLDPHDGRGELARIR